MENPASVSPQVSPQNQGTLKQNKKIKIAVEILVAAVLILVALFFIKFNKKQSVKLPTSQTDTTVLTPLRKQQDALLGKSTLKFSETGKSEGAQASDFPISLTFFLKPVPEVRNLKIEKTLSASKAMEFHVTYEVMGMKLIDLYHKFLSNITLNGWTVIDAQRAELFALIETQNKTYNSLISLSQISEQGIGVAMTFGEK